MDPAWHRDVATVTTTVLTTTGGTLWSAATRCADYLEAMAAAVGLHKPGMRVLELGAGCGTLGLTVARNCPSAAEVCLTEQAYGGALQHLRRNVAANTHLPHMGSVTCRACDWTHFTQPAVLQAAAQAAAARSGGHVTAAAAAAGSACLDSRQQAHAAEQLQQQQQQESAVDAASTCSSGVSHEELLDLHTLLTTPWDLIVGSDLIYNKEGAHALPKVLAALMTMEQHCEHCDSTRSDSQLPPPVQQQQQQQQQQRQQHCEHCDRRQQQQQQPQSRQHTSSNSRCPAACSAAAGCQQEPRQYNGRLLATCSSRVIAGRPSTHHTGPVMLYAHTKHRYDTMDVLLFERLEAEGLTVEEVIEAGQELPTPSPPPFSSLFPDMRCAVLRIYRPS